MGKRKGRLRKGSVPCQAVCASVRAGDGQPQESPVILLQPLHSLPKPQHAACPLQEPSCAQDMWAVGRAGRTCSRRWANRSSQCPVAHRAPFWGSQVWVAGKRCSRKGQERAQCGTGPCSGDLMAQAAGMGAAPHQYPRAGWGQGCWHQPGRLEALGCLSFMEQETLAAEAAKCFVIHPSPSGIFPGQPLCPHPSGSGHTQSPARGKGQALLFLRAASSGGRCSAPVEGRVGCQALF